MRLWIVTAIALITALLMNAERLLAQEYEEVAKTAQGRAMHERLEKVIQSGLPLTGYLQTGTIATNFSLTFSDYNAFSGTFHAKLGGDLAKKCSKTWRVMSSMLWPADKDKDFTALDGQLNEAGDLNLELPILSCGSCLSLSFPASNPQEDKASGTYKLRCIGLDTGTGQGFLNMQSGNTLNIPPKDKR